MSIFKDGPFFVLQVLGPRIVVAMKLIIECEEENWFRAARSL